jgi:hypothetical protein
MEYNIPVVRNKSRKRKLVIWTDQVCSEPQSQIITLKIHAKYMIEEL